ncbi:MAG: hypothetical protein D4R65_07075 [Verrucomicrobiaceae bacterium]|nr:MAG: hypothetical protein D4R65_07075 [Verrucomicrobiaceae bacterium]
MSVGSKKPKLRRFNKRLAIDIARKRKVNKPDISAALVAQTIYTWQNTRGRKHEIDGTPGAYQSAAGLSKDLPWLSVRAIADAISRLEEAFEKDFRVVRNGTTVKSFSLRKALIEKYMNKENEDSLYFRVDDAEQLGVLKALLIGNLEYRTSNKFKRAAKDFAGMAYNSISASALTKKESENDAIAIFPYSREEVAKAMTELKASGVFKKHPTMDGVFRVNREMLLTNKVTESADILLSETAKSGCEQTAKQCEQTAKGVSKLPMTVSKLPSFPLLDIEDRMKDRVEFKVSVYSARASHSQNLCSNQNIQEQTDNQRLAGSGCALPSVECEPPARANALAKYIHPTDCEIKAMESGCKSVEDFFPGTLEKVNRMVAKYRAMLEAGTLLSVVPPDEQSPFEIILDPVYAGWLELDVDISPITNKPIDYGDMEEQIDLAIYYLDEPMVHDASKKDLAAFRSLFHQYPALLDINTLKGVFEHLCFLEDEPPKKVKNKYVHDREYFAKRIQTLEQFVRYFPQLFAEAYVGYDDKPEFYNGKPQRNWDRLLDDNEGTIPEPYWSILAPYYKEDQANRAIGLEADDQLASASNEDQDRTQIKDYRQKLQIWPEDHEDDPLFITNANFWADLDMQDCDDNRLNDSALVCGVNQ